MVKNILVCDIDGVICKYPSNEFLGELKESFNFTFSDLEKLKLEVPSDIYKSIKKNYRYKGSKFKVSIYPEAVEVLNELHSLGSHIIMQTSRPTDNFIKLKTYEWLIDSGLKFDQFIINPYKYETHYFNPSQKIAVVDDLVKNFQPYQNNEHVCKVLFKNDRLGEAKPLCNSIKITSSWNEVEVILKNFFSF